jgi:Flp pilus assembly protein TadG
VCRLIKRLRAENGQALVELAFVLPLVLLFLFGIIDFGLALNTQNEDTNIANIAVREAAVLGTTSTVVCTLNGTPTTEHYLADWTKCEAQVLGEAAPATVCVYDTAGATPSAASYTTGDPVEVSVSSSFGWLKLITGKVGNLSSTIGASATMRVEGTITGANTFLTNGATGNGTC